MVLLVSLHYFADITRHSQDYPKPQFYGAVMQIGAHGPADQGGDPLALQIGKAFRGFHLRKV
jgi:hypothetical protein